jgi:hypothetical protein
VSRIASATVRALGVTLRGSITAAILVLLSAPVLGVAAEPSVLLSLPGDQTWPTLFDQKLLFVEEVAGQRDVFLADLARPSDPIRQVSSTGDVLGGPEASGSVVAFRRADAIERYSLMTGRLLQPIEAPGDGRVAVSQVLVAWEQQGTGGSDVAWLPTDGVSPAIYARPGAQRAVAAAYGWIAYVDDAEGGSVHLLDTSMVDPADAATFEAADTVVYARLPGDGEPAVDVALWAADEGSVPRVAVTVTVAPLHDDVLVFASPTDAPVRLGAGGGKRNVHLLREWVAYDGYSTGVSQVWLWEWTSGRNFYAAWSDTPQSLNHLVAVDDGVEVIWTGVGTQGLDIFRFVLTETEEPDPSPSEVTCSTADATVLADFTVTMERTGTPVESDRDDGDRDDDDGDDGDDDDGDDDRDDRDDHGADGWHLRDSDAHDERWHSDWKWRAFGHASFASPAARRVLVCIDSVDVSAAWVGVGSEIVAMPADFSSGTVAREARVTIAAGDGRAAALVIARRGGSLRVRVLDDPLGDPDAPAEGDTCSARGDCPPPPGGWVSRLGCGSSGGSATLLSLLLLGLVAARPLRRPRR